MSKFWLIVDILFEYKRTAYQFVLAKNLIYEVILENINIVLYSFFWLETFFKAEFTKLDI